MTVCWKATVCWGSHVYSIFVLSTLEWGKAVAKSKAGRGESVELTPCFTVKTFSREKGKVKLNEEALILV